MSSARGMPGRGLRARASALRWCAFAALWLAACDGCKEKPVPPLATLVELQGTRIERDFAAQREAWQPAALRAEFRLGDGVRTHAPSRALLALVDGARLHVQPDTTVRFLIEGTQAGEQGIDVLAGEAVLLAAGELRLRTHVGLAILTSGARIRLTRADQALDLQVEVGEARFRSSAGQDVRVQAGEEVRLSLGMAVLRGPRSVENAEAEKTQEPAPAPVPEPADAGAPVADVIVAQGEADALAKDARSPARALADDFAPGPEYANFSVRAGESFVVHAPEAPVAIAFDFGGKCKGEGVLELPQAKQRARATGRGNLLLPAGVRGYTLRCLDARGAPGSVVARGSVHVLQDEGTRKLPPSAPTSFVDADGRSYTIYYQNQLPNVRVRWPNAPSADSYTLDVDGKVSSVSAPEQLLRSGSVRDGLHRITFEAKGRKSRPANVEVRFDNAAPTASLSAPSNRGFGASDEVIIEGVALAGWKVSAQGGTIASDGADRFKGEVVTSAANPDIAVRLTHPRRGTHYYLRRARGSR